MNHFYPERGEEMATKSRTDELQKKIAELANEITSDQKLIEEKRTLFTQAFKAGKAKDVPVDLLILESTLTHKQKALEEYQEELREEQEIEKQAQIEKEKKAYNALVKKRRKLNDELEATLKGVTTKMVELLELDIEQRHIRLRLGMAMNRRPTQAFERFCIANLKGIMPIEGMRIPGDIGKTINDIDLMTKEL